MDAYWCRIYSIKTLIIVILSSINDKKLHFFLHNSKKKQYLCSRKSGINVCFDCEKQGINVYFEYKNKGINVCYDVKLLRR